MASGEVPFFGRFLSEGQVGVALVFRLQVQVLMDEGATAAQQESNLAGMELALGQLRKAGKGGQVIGDRGGRAAQDAANFRGGLALQGQAYHFDALCKHRPEVVREATQGERGRSLRFQRSMASSSRSPAPRSDLRMVAHTKTTSAFRSVDRPRDQVSKMSTLCLLLLRDFGGTSAGTHAGSLQRWHPIRVCATSHACTSSGFQKVSARKAPGGEAT